MLHKIKVDGLSKIEMIEFYNLKGSNSHKMQSFRSAFDSYSKMNNIVKTLPNFNDKGRIEYIKHYTAQLNFLKNVGHTIKPSVSLSGEGLVFLVGFPRSGTTLLDTILRTNSRTVIMEEKPCLAEAKRYFYSVHSQHITNGTAWKDLLQKTSDIYYDELREEFPTLNKVVVDKFPLNMLEVPFILQVFPNAKVICALRHPLDCILSCFMQNFQMNSAMANFTSLRDSAVLYDLCFQTLTTYAEKASSEIIFIR